MLRSLLRFRRRMVLVDEAAYMRLCALAALGEAIEIVLAEEQRWLLLDLEGETQWPGL